MIVSVRRPAVLPVPSRLLLLLASAPPGSPTRPAGRSDRAGWPAARRRGRRRAAPPCSRRTRARRSARPGPAQQHAGPRGRPCAPGAAGGAAGRPRAAERPGPRGWSTGAAITVRGPVGIASGTGGGSSAVRSGVGGPLQVGGGITRVRSGSAAARSRPYSQSRSSSRAVGIAATVPVAPGRTAQKCHASQVALITAPADKMACVTAAETQPETQQSDGEWPGVSVVMPVLNEERHLRRGGRQGAGPGLPRRARGDLGGRAQQRPDGGDRQLSWPRPTAGCGWWTTPPPGPRTP